jgi:hypothetical protein
MKRSTPTENIYSKTQYNIQPTHAGKLYEKRTFVIFWVPLEMFYAMLNLRSRFCASQVHLRKTFRAGEHENGSTSRICLAQVQRLTLSCAKSGALVDLRKSLSLTNPKEQNP